MDHTVIEIEVEDGPIDVPKFWELVDNLLYSKVYYNPDTNEYFSRRYGNLCTDDNLKFSESDSEGREYFDKEIEKCTEEEINTLLVSFIALAAKYSDEMSKQIGEEEFYTTFADFIMKFKYYQTHSDFCIRKMLSLLVYAADSNLNNLKLNVNELNDSLTEEVNESIETNEKIIKVIGWIFHIHYQYHEEELLKILRDYNGFTALVKVTKNYIAISKTVTEGSDLFGVGYKNFMVLFCELSKSYDFTAELGDIDVEDLSYFLEQLKLEAERENELNFWKFRMLLVLNEQYIYQCGLDIYHAGHVNLIIDAMLKDIKRFQTFNEMLIFNFNREMNLVDQILIMKFLYVIFFNKETNKLVYLNDIKVIVDIIIRQLNDLQLQVSEYLVNIYLRVLQCMLVNTDLAGDTYKVDELGEVLNYLIGNEEASEKTKHLAKKCMKCDFFKGKQTQSCEMLKSFDNMKISSKLKSPSLPNLNMGDNVQGTQHSRLQPLCIDADATATATATATASVTVQPPIRPPPRGFRYGSSSMSPLSPTSPSSANSKPSTLFPPPPPPPRSHSSSHLNLSPRVAVPLSRFQSMQLENLHESLYGSGSSVNSSMTSLGLNVPSGTTYDAHILPKVSPPATAGTSTMPLPSPPPPPPPPPPRGLYRVGRASSVVSIGSEVSAVSTSSSNGSIISTNNTGIGLGPGTGVGSILSAPSSSISSRTRYKGKPPPPPAYV